MEEKEIKICFYCATIFRSTSEVLECPNCNRKIPISEYEKVLMNVRDVVQYGWNYRLEYEKLLKKNNKIDRHFSLEQYIGIINFVALAIMSGMIGNFSYDIVKKVIEKVYAQVKKSGNKKYIAELQRTEQKIDLLAQYIDDFCNHPENINEEVKNAIDEEIIIDKLTEIICNSEFNKNQDHNLKNNLKKDNVQSLSFEDFWKDIDRDI